MLPPRILGLLVLLLAVQGLCKPTKSTEESDYEDDTPFDDEDEEDEDEEADNTGTAEAPPQILSYEKSIRVYAGSTVELPCQVTHTENYVVAWLKDEKYLYVESQAHTEDYKRIVRLSNNSLIIYNASVEDSSNNYKCSILRKPDSIDLIHRLRVEPAIVEGSHQLSTPSSPPQHSYKRIRVIPSRRIETYEGQTIRLGCETDIQPPPEIKWFIENKKVDDYDPDVILDGNYITIKKVNKSHSGRYQCLAEDGSNEPANERIIVVVKSDEPKIEVERSIVYSGAGIESKMTCIVSAYPEAIIIWSKDNKKLTHNKELKMEHRIINGNKTKHTLKIMHTSARDFGKYECRAENVMGENAKSIILTGAPSQATVYSVETDDAGIIMKWRLESYSPINQYKLEYRRKGDQKWHTVEPEVEDGKGNQFIVEYPLRNLQPGTYETILTAKNAFGWSPESKLHTFTNDYPPDLALKEENAATVRSPETLLALILVVLSCAFTSL